MGREPNHTTARKPGPLSIIEYSVDFCIEFVYFRVSMLLSLNCSYQHFPREVNIYFIFKSFLIGGENLKGLSHEIDFKNFDKNLQNLA